MRQDVHHVKTELAMAASRYCAPCWNRLLVTYVAMSLVAVSGCQTMLPTRTPLPNGPAHQSGSNTSFKPQTDLTTTSPYQAAPIQSNSATVRGQSPNPSFPPNGWNGNPPGSNNYRNPMPATDASGNRYAPQTAPTNLTAPATQYPVTTPAPQNGSGYSAPLPPPTTALQPQTPAVGGQTGSGFVAPGGGTPGVGTLPSPSDYESTIAPGAVVGPTPGDSLIVPGVIPYVETTPGITAPGAGGYRPRQRVAPIDVYVQEARTGRIIIGGSVNSDLGVAGNIVIDERNFNIRRFPRSFGDLWSGRAFRGAGQNFRLELMPGNRVERYTVSWSERNLFGFLPYSLSVGGFYYTRQFRDWTEQRLGGRIALGYEVTKDLSVSAELRMEDVKLFDPRIAGVPQLDSALGSNDIYTGRFRVVRDTRDSPFMPSRGGLLELNFDQVFGEYDYSRGNLNYSRYFKVRERADGAGRHILASTFRAGVTGSQTPIFENYFAGGYSTLRGFSFRGASPKVGDVQVGGRLMMLGSLEYIFPLTADEMLRGVAFVDYGTVEQDLTIRSENFRVAPGLGVRVAVPALGPAPLAFDFAFPVNHADTDDRQVFSFFMGFTR